MNYRKFGNTSLTVSEIGFGAWAIGGGAMVGNTAIGWGDADDDTSVKAIHTALEQGINFFDTADIYGLGHSEELLGRELAHRADVVIATKVGNVARNGIFTTDYDPAYILQACEASLRRLRRDTIDYYQLHSARLPQLQQGDCIAAMQQLQQQGKIRYWGLSLNTFDPFEDAHFLLHRQLGNGFQLVLNILNQYALPLLREAAANGFGIIARMPLQFGLLTRKFDTQASFDPNDHRRNRLTADVIAASREALEPVWQLCSRYNATAEQLALSYVLSYPEVSTIIPGIRTAEQARLNTTGLFQLKAEDRELIEGLGAGPFAKVMELIRSKG